MHRYSHIFMVVAFSLLVVLCLQTLLLYTWKQDFKKEKDIFVSLVKLPDLALSNGANFIRHRSLSDTFSLFSNGPELLEFFPSTFTYNYSPTLYKNPSKIDHVP